MKLKMFYKRSKLKQPVCPKCRNDFIGRATDMENFLMVSFISEVWTPFPFQIDSFFIESPLHRCFCLLPVWHQNLASPLKNVSQVMICVFLSTFHNNYLTNMKKDFQKLTRVVSSFASCLMAWVPKAQRTKSMEARSWIHFSIFYLLLIWCV